MSLAFQVPRSLWPCAALLAATIGAAGCSEQPPPPTKSTTVDAPGTATGSDVVSSAELKAKSQAEAATEGDPNGGSPADSAPLADQSPPALDKQTVDGAPVVPQPAEVIETNQPEPSSDPIAPLKKLGGRIELNFADDVVNVDLKGTPATDTDVAVLQQFTELRSLNLSNTRVTDEGLKHIRGLTKLRDLYLYAAPITDAGLEHIRKHEQLKRICLEQTPITDRGVATLAGLWRLESLHLEGSGITADSVPYLKKLDRLTDLRLIDTMIGEAQLDELEEAIPGVKISLKP